METTVKFTAREQTPEQRQQLIDKATAWSVAQGAAPSPRAQALYARYVAGELSLQGVTDELKRQEADRVAPVLDAGSIFQPVVQPQYTQNEQLLSA